jgi:aspartate oxidase
VVEEWRIDAHLKATVQDLMWQKVGLIRRWRGLAAAVKSWKDLAVGAGNLRSRHFATLAGSDRRRRTLA